VDGRAWPNDAPLTSEQVLNGIAYDPASSSFYVPVSSGPSSSGWCWRRRKPRPSGRGLQRLMTPR